MDGPHDRCLAAGLELRPALEATTARGFAHVPAALSDEYLARLQGEVETGPLEPAQREVGEVRQELEGYLVAEGDGEHPLADRLRDELGRRVRAEGAHLEGIDAFRPNEVRVQRYPASGVGITPHRDESRLRPLIAIFTTRGRARFTVHPERHAAPLASWEVVPGDLVLLRGPGLGGVEDGRPFHAVTGPEDDVRYSVAVRRRAASPIGARRGPATPG